MKNLLICYSIALSLLSPGTIAAQQPNIIIIMADDMGYSDIGCFGSEIKTPNLDQLANAGLSMTQFYNASRCCPSRASLLTGLYPHQAGIGDMVDPKPLPAYQGYLSKNAVTIAEVLQSVGYQTYMSGKWHVGSKPDHWPLKRGFQHYYGLIDGASSYFHPTDPYRPQQKLRLVQDHSPIEPEAGWYATDAYTDHAIDYISSASSNPEKPFFLYLAYTSPHWPLHALQTDIAKYRGSYKKIGWDSLRQQRLRKMTHLGILPSATKLSPRDLSLPAWDRLSEQEKDKWDMEMSVYAAMIDRMDQNIGRLIAQLKAKGQLDNTLIFFLSDNGASHEEIAGNFLPEIIQASKKSADDPASFAAYGKAGANVSNTPFSYYKHWQNEGGISTPLIVSYPKLMKKKMINHQPAHIMDLMPTCLAAAGIVYPLEYKGQEIKPAAGESLLPILHNQNWRGHEVLFFEHEGNKAVRQGNWKLVSTFPEKAWRLYNMATDRSEQKDLSAAYPEKVQAMKKLFDGWATEVGVVPYEQLKTMK